MEDSPRNKITREDFPDDPVLALKKVLAIKARQSRNRALSRYNPHKQQLRFHWLGLRKMLRFFFGGNRTGKTIAGGAEVAFHLTGQYPAWWPGKRFDGPIRCWVCSETGEVVRDVAQKVLLGNPGDLGGGLIPKEFIGRVTMRRGIADAVDSVRVRHKSGRWSLLQFKSYDQGRRKFQGTSRHVVWCDEEPPKDVFDEIRMRVMDVQGHILLTMTPLQGMSDVCLLALGDPPDPDAAFILASWQDNPYLRQEQISRLEKALMPHEREARQYGRPTVGPGKIYPFPRSLLEYEDFELPHHWPRLAGMDFGWTHPTALLWAAWDEASDTIYVYSEHYLAEQPPNVHAQAIRARGEWIPIAGDPHGQQSSQKDGENLFQSYADVDVIIMEADDSVEAGIVDVYMRMQSGRLKISKSLRYFWKEYDLYHRNEKGKIVEHLDDLMDALRYLVRSIGSARRRPYGGVVSSGGRRSDQSVDTEFGGF